MREVTLSLNILWKANGRYATVAHYGDRQSRWTLCGVIVNNTGDDGSPNEVDCKRCLRMISSRRLLIPASQ